MKQLSFLNRADVLLALNYEPFEKVEKTAEKPKEVDSLLDIIYSKDPITGLPRGDLSMFLSDKTNPQVRLFIEQNLLTARSENTPSVLPDDVVNQYRKVLTDDDIARYTRNHGESIEEYTKRMYDDISEQRRQFYFQKKLSSLEKKLRHDE